MKTLITFRITAIIVFAGILKIASGQFTKNIQYFRPYDQHGINVFEASKNDTVTYQGFRLRLGANFTQGFQALKHSNTSGIGLYDMSPGFPLAQANLNIDVQVADGVHVQLITYLSSHHHNETWVKGGYFQIDKVAFLNSDLLNQLWKNLTLKIGHMEINYGDQHFRRSDGGNTIYNPFMENYIIDAFNTEIGAELYWRRRGILLMYGMTNGENQGSVAGGGRRSPSIYGKAGVDLPFFVNARFRLTGSLLTKKSSINSTLFNGDRTGSNYQFVMEPTTATVTGNAFSGRLNPGLSDNVTTFMINPFIKVFGFEFFGMYESAMGRTAVENGEVPFNATTPVLTQQPNRKFNQLVTDVLYRFGGKEQVYIGARYNTVKADLAFWDVTLPVAVRSVQTVTVNRVAFAAGWFITPNILAKGEYVMQEYKDYPTGQIFTGGKFNGIVLQGSIGF